MEGQSRESVNGNYHETYSDGIAIYADSSDKQEYNDNEEFYSEDGILISIGCNSVADSNFDKTHHFLF